MKQSNEQGAQYRYDLHTLSHGKYGGISVNALGVRQDSPLSEAMACLIFGADARLLFLCSMHHLLSSSLIPTFERVTAT